MWVRVNVWYAVGCDHKYLSSNLSYNFHYFKCIIYIRLFIYIFEIWRWFSCPCRPPAIKYNHLHLILVALFSNIQKCRLAVSPVYPRIIMSRRHLDDRATIINGCWDGIVRFCTLLYAVVRQVIIAMLSSGRLYVERWSIDNSVL